MEWNEVNSMGVSVPRAVLIKFCVFWFLWWYFHETIVLLFSYLMNVDTFYPLAELKIDLPDVLAKAITIVFLSMSWPLHIALLAVLALIDFGYFGFDYFFQLRFLLLYLTGVVTLLFTLILWKADKIWI